MSKLTVTLAGAMLVAAVAAAPGLVQAADFPSRNIEFIVPYAPGGSSDNFVRSLQPGLEKSLGGTIVVRNMAGGGGAIGFMQTLAAKPDGHTVTTPNNAIFTLQGLGNVTFDYKDFNYLARVLVEPYVLTVRPNEEWSTLEKFVDYAKQNPRKVKIAFSGVGSSTHIMTVVLAGLLGVELEPIPYEGGAPAVAAAMGGHVDGVVQHPAEILSGVEGGRLKALVTSGEKRAEVLPDTPTLKEAGYDFSAYQWRGIAAPKGISDEVEQAWVKAIQEAVQDPEFVQAAKNLGTEVDPLYGEELDAFVDEMAELMIAEAQKIKQ